MLTLTFLGVGSAFAKRNFHSNALVEAWSQGPDQQGVPDDNLLIDFGSTGPLALYALKTKKGFEYLNDHGNIHYHAIARIFITHQHFDHIGGLDELAWLNVAASTGRGDPKKPFKPQLISAKRILSDLWNTSLKGGLSVLNGRNALMEDYFVVKALDENELGAGSFRLMDRYELRIFPTDHVQIHKKYDWPSYGLSIHDHDGDESVFYSGDTRFDPKAYLPMMRRAKVCFHEVQLTDEPHPVHSLLSELRTLPTEVRRITHLYHFDDGWDDSAYNFVAEEFAGFAQPHHRYVLFE